MNEIDFDIDGMTEYEVEEMLDGLLNILAENIEEQENKTSIINPVKYKQIQGVYNALRYMTRDSKVKVSCHLHKPYHSTCYISISGKNISFSNPNWFNKISEYASNIEIYPKTDGTTQVNLMFYDLTLPLE